LRPGAVVPTLPAKMGTTAIRTVRFVEGTATRGRARLWAFGYDTVAALSGMTAESVKKATQRRRGRAPSLDMADLESVMAFIARRHRRRAMKR
jgi:hypothetical protein